MLRATEIVIAKIKASQCQFDTSPDTLKQLKEAEVPDSVILAMIEKVKPSVDQSTTVLQSEMTEPLGEVPRIFIEALQGESLDYDFWRGFHTDNDLNTLPEIARMVDQKSQEYGFPVSVVFEKEASDFIWLLGREKKWNSRMYTWNLIDRRSSSPIAYGKENWFRNAIKDMLNFARTGWNALKLREEAENSVSGDLSKRFPLRLELATKKIRKGAHKDNFGRVFVTNTIDKVTVKVVSLNPDIATLEHGAASVELQTSGGATNVAEFKIFGTGKKGQVYFNALVLSLDN
jgi:hypothetical protein